MPDKVMQEMLVHLNEHIEIGHSIKDCPTCQAIRALIIAVGEWQRRAEALLCSSHNHPATTRELLGDIRDFGKEEADE